MVRRPTGDKRLEAINWTYDGLNYWRIYATLGLDGL